MNISKAISPKWKSLLSFPAVIAVCTIAACTVRTPTTETPPPSDRGIDKSFFAETKSDGSGKSVLQPKTFLCGWAPISESGAIASSFLTHAVHMSGHCNMEFEITEDNLIGRMVNPSFPNDRKRWKQSLVIPIRKHFYYEKAKDSYGRETNEFIENTARSHWSARPKMELGLEGLSVKDWDLAMFWGARNGGVLAIEDVEWDQANQFLGFTALVQDHDFGAAMGARIRFNFKAFDHNPKFETTPYNQLNNKYFNALHVVGEKVDGLHQVWSAAKWDLSKTHDVYLHGFPEAYVPAARNVIESWNDALQKIGKPRAFKLNLTKMKHPYDLRYPMMVWVDDPQISSVSPLGVGMAQADVRNGEILWGQITLYGGMLERYVKMHLSAGSPSADPSAKTPTAANTPATAPLYFESRYFNSAKALGADVGNLRSILSGRTDAHADGRFNSRGESSQIAGAVMANRLVQKISELKSMKGQTLTPAQIEQNRQEAARISRDLNQSFQAMTSNIQTRLSSFSQNDGAQTLRRALGFRESISPTARKQLFGEQAGQLSTAEKDALVYAKAKHRIASLPAGVVHDTDRLLVDVGPSLVTAISNSRIDFDSAMRKVIAELIMHEYGHFLGLGHQFKENILPEAGSVPAKYLAELKTDAERNLTNSTSVMGYKHPFTEIQENESKIGPGPQDLLTLRYLYNSEYATFRRGSTDADFTFFKVPASGLIPDRNPERAEFATSYFPQCNDFDASFSADPYCNRFDRGYNAETIVRSYIEDLNTNMVSKIYAFADSMGGNTEEAEANLWWRALNSLGRVRIFYDYMRQKYESQISEISRSQSDLYEFSRVCTGEIPGSARLQAMFEKAPEFKELCRVNRYAVKEMTNLLVIPGPDQSRMDWNNASIAANMTGGDADPDYSRVWGTHTALSVLPLKLSAMNALSTPSPYTMLGGGMFPIPRYSSSDGLFSYSSLYPFEFTQAIAAGAEKNLMFGTEANPLPTMGRPFFSLGYFIDQQWYSNEASRFPKDYIESIRRQSAFRFTMKAIILNFKTRDDKTRVTHFEAELYDPNTDKTVRIPEAYILPGGKLIVRPPSRNFVYPVTKIMFLADGLAYVWSYHIEYEKERNDLLEAHGLRTALEKVHTEILDSCIRGNNNGLSSFFNGQEDAAQFPGFLALANIANDDETQHRFLDSIQENFKLYYTKYKNTQDPPSEGRCERARLGQSLIVSSAALMQGYFLPEVLDALVK